MSITSLFERMLGRKAGNAAPAKDQPLPLPRIHIVSLAASGSTHALAKALEAAHFTDAKM